MTKQELKMWQEDIDMIIMLRERNEKLQCTIEELKKWAKDLGLWAVLDKLEGLEVKNG